MRETKEKKYMSTKTSENINKLTNTHGEPRNSLGLVGIQKIQVNIKNIKLVM